MKQQTKKWLLIFNLALMSGLGYGATSYPLVCRGGGGTLGYNAEAGGAALFYFQKSAQPAGMGLAPGQCSWVDRAIGANEPPCVRQNNVKVAAWMFPGQMGNSYFSSSDNTWLRKLLSGANFQTFQVYNPGNGGCFVVTRLGP